MKKIMNIWLMAALLCGLCLGVTSCKDDDDDNNSNKSEEQKAEEQAGKLSKFWNVVGQLVSSDDYTEDYEDKTFEPTYGIAESEGSLTRIVETNDMATAARRFADLVDANIDENTPSYTYSDPEVGTLTYTRGGTANEWATVDVNIKQVPSLRKIIYREGGEGTNAYFNQKSWYRFGDVVSRTNSDGQKEYWICVRPAFGLEKKSDSHWVCLNVLPSKNVHHVSGSNGTNYYVPTGVGKDKENMQNLAEMLYAIAFPGTWYDNANNYHTDGLISFSGVPIFADFKKANLQYHNSHFWERVKQAWLDKKIAENAMNADLNDLASRLDQEGVTLLYHGFSWWESLSWNCTLYQASYTNGTKNGEKNLHHAVYTEPEKNMKDISFDCRTMGKKTDNYQGFFGNDGKLRWVVRHAEGKDLNGGRQPAPTARIQGGCTDEYRYYDVYPSEWTKADPNGGNGPEISEEPEYVQHDIPAKVGAIVGANGLFYENKTDCEDDDTQPIAMVVYLSTDGQRVEKDQPWTGLALALADEPGADGTGKFKWTDVDKAHLASDLCATAVGGGRRTDEGSSGDADTDYRACILDGWAMTKRLAQHECFNHSHPAAEAAWNTDRPAGFSEWFMPSIGQWILAIKGMGYERQYSSSIVFGYNNYRWSFKDNGKWLWEEAGVPEAALKTDYATTTQAISFASEFYKFNGGRSFENTGKYSANYRVRRMIAFGEGGIQNPAAVPQPIEPRPGAVITSQQLCFATLDDLKVYFKETDAIGMVVYYSKTKRVEEGEDYCGLAIALKDYGEKQWCSDDTKAGQECSVAVSGAADYAKGLYGCVITELLAKTEGHTHPAAKAANQTLSNVSHMFLPSAGQWILAMQGLGYTWSTDGIGHFNTAGKWPWVAAGLAQFATADIAEYWTVTEQKDGNSYKALAVRPNGTSFLLRDKTEKALVRPFFAFGHWGKE